MKSLFFTVLLSACAAASFAQTPMIGNCTVLPANNIWNTPIDTLPVASNSATYINTIGPGTGMHADFGSGTWNGGPIGIPFVTVPGTQTKYPATFTYADESDPGPYAVPLNAPIEGGSGSTGDRHAISIDTDGCILYELYSAYPQAASWQAGSGIVISLTSNALRTAGWTSADAAGLPIFPGLVRYDEVAAGQINHALRFTVPNTLKGYVWPARHQASSLTDPKYPPMGQRFRLKAGFDITPYPADVQVILKALKKYGMMIADNGSAWYLSGAPDSRWNNSNLAKLSSVLGSNFEAVDVSSLMVDPNTGQAKQPGNSVTVTPGSATVNTGASQQFAASVQGSTDQSVTWAVNGVTGGSSPIGFISAGGLYTAPLIVPSPATVTIEATSVAMTSVTGSATVTIKALAAPSISSVTPNPLTTGSFTLTVNGANFQSGAVAKLAGTALATTFVSASRLTATGSTSATGSAVPVTVLNPDGQVSAAYNIAVNAPSTVSVTVSPTSARVRINRSTTFTATVSGSTNKSVTWQVNGVTGGNSTVGRITSAGVYTAPSAVPSPSTVTVRALSAADPTKSATASVTVRR
jgi:hypothetical protein